MGMTYTAAFAQTPQTYTAVCTTAGTWTSDSPSNTVLLLTAGANGNIVNHIWAMPRDTVTATALFLFVSTNSGTTQRLIDSVLLPANTASATTAMPQTIFTNYSEASPLRLAAGAQLYVSIGVSLANGIVFYAQSVDF